MLTGPAQFDKLVFESAHQIYAVIARPVRKLAASKARWIRLRPASVAASLLFPKRRAFPAAMTTHPIFKVSNCSSPICVSVYPFSAP